MKKRISVMLNNKELFNKIDTEIEVLNICSYLKVGAVTRLGNEVILHVTDK